jgi:hypothetical protein
MALISPGVEIDVINNSTSPGASPGTIPLIVLASAANKISPLTSNVASGTTAANAGQLTLLTSQRDLLTQFGSPTFYKTASGTALNAYELNEYGLMTAYNILGITNTAYVLRANIDLSQLVGTTVRPTGAPQDGSFWLNLGLTTYGLNVWNATTQTFTNVTPTVLTTTTNLSSGVPINTYGTIGSYVVVAYNSSVPQQLYYKNASNTWVEVGTTAWQNSFATVIGSVTNPTFTIGNTITINTITVTATGTTVSSFVGAINTAAIPGVTAAVDANGRVNIFATSAAESNGSVADGKVIIANGTGTILTNAGIASATYYAPKIQFSLSTQVPTWLAQDPTPEPTGSLWVKTNAVNGGLNFSLAKFNATLSTFNYQACNAYASDVAANAGLDPVGGGANIKQGASYVEYNVANDGTVSFLLYQRFAAGATTVTGTSSTAVLTPGNTFTIQVSQPGASTLPTPVTVTLTGTTIASLVGNLLALNIPNFTASVNGNGNIVMTNTSGGVIVLTPGTGTPLTTVGITTSTAYVRAYPFNGTALIVSNWTLMPYVASTTQPSQNPAEDTLWYFNSPTDVDVMINDGTAWKGYQTVTYDARGYNLTQTDPNGVICEASQPLTQTTGTALVPGDLWLNTSDLEHFPLLYRYTTNPLTSVNSWVLINNTDSTSSNGIIFADARWDSSGTTDIVSGALPSTVGLLTSNYVDLDAPNPALYPRGTLLYNTRRSGYNIKEFESNYFNAQSFSGSLPAVKNAWVTAIGNRVDGTPYFGRKAQRAMVVAAMNSVVETNQDIRSEQFFYNLICAPGYTEVAPQMINLNADIKNVAFVVSETPMRLNNNATEIVNWSSGGTGTTFQDEVLHVADTYTGVWYSCGQTTDLSGNAIIMPPSYMALAGIIYSDSISHQWFSPAGTTRGVVNNATAIGYVDGTTGNFVTNSVNQGLRDTLYANNINPITFIPNSGILLWGNLTRDANGQSTALGSINIARLICYLRYRLNILSRPFLFQPNDKITRDQIAAITNQLLNTLITQRAISDYLVVCDTSNNTPATISARELFMDVAIVPITDVEFIFIPLVIDQPGTTAIFPV